MIYSNINKFRSELLDKIGLDCEVIRAKGAKLYLKDGREISDFVAQYGAIPFGYNPPFLEKVLTDWVDNDHPSLIQPLYCAPAEQLAESLFSFTEHRFDRVTFTTSGAETVEAAIKLVRAKSNCSWILSTTNSYHGKTLGALSATGRDLYKEAFHVDTTHFDHIPYDDIDALATALSSKQYAAFIVEPVQGEGGMVTPSSGYLKTVSDLCKQHSVTFILDEIQTGFGRTGKRLSCIDQNISPDILCLSKALGGGLVPIGAMLFTSEMVNDDFDQFHSSTFGINGFTAAVSKAFVDYYIANEQQILAKISHSSGRLFGEINTLVAEYPAAFDSLSGKGLMMALHLKPWSGDNLYFSSLASTMGFSVPIVCGYLFNVHGIYCMPTLNTKNSLRIQPSFVIDDSQIDHLIRGLKDVGDLISSNKHHQLMKGCYRDTTPALLSSQYQSQTNIDSTDSQPIGRRLDKVAFFTHPTTPDSIYGDIAIQGTGLIGDRAKEIKRWMKRVVDWSKDFLEVGKLLETHRIYNTQGDYVELDLISSMLLPMDLLKLTLPKRKQLLDNYVASAVNCGASYAGLGAYTSVISASGVNINTDALHITTGNSLTAMCAVHGMIQAMECAERPIDQCIIGVVGAYGSVGRLTALGLIKYVNHIVLIGNSKNPLSQKNLRITAGELYDHALKLASKGICTGLCGQVLEIDKTLIEQHTSHPAEDKDDSYYEELYDTITELSRALGKDIAVQISIRIQEWTKRLDGIISSTSNGKGFIRADLLRDNVVICDTAQPSDFVNLSDFQPSQRFFHGGLISFPVPDFRLGAQNLTNLPTGVTFACLAEAIVISMMGVKKNVSIGKQPAIEQAEEIYANAIKFGFRPYLNILNENRQVSHTCTS